MDIKFTEYGTKLNNKFGITGSDKGHFTYAEILKRLRIYKKRKTIYTIIRTN